MLISTFVFSILFLTYGTVYGDDITVSSSSILQRIKGYAQSNAHLQAIAPKLLNLRDKIHKIVPEIQNINLTLVKNCYQGRFNNNKNIHLFDSKTSLFDVIHSYYVSSRFSFFNPF